MVSVRRTISLPPAIAARLDRASRRRDKSLSAIVAELVEREPETVPYAGLIDDDPELSKKVHEVLKRLGR
jgi:predicted DNA-binding protein